jgi:hypothetical protein
LQSAQPVAHDAYEQLPLVQPGPVVWGGTEVQPLAQPPQLFTSVCSLTQIPEQSSSPAGQRQLPLEQEPVPSQVVPLVAVGFEHWPVVVSQVPGTWQTPCAVQATEFEPMQLPCWHWSVRVQALSSLQVVPFGCGGLLHCPDDGSQVPTWWH